MFSVYKVSRSHCLLYITSTPHYSPYTKVRESANVDHFLGCCRKMGLSQGALFTVEDVSSASLGGASSAGKLI